MCTYVYTLIYTFLYTWLSSYVVVMSNRFQSLEPITTYCHSHDGHRSVWGKPWLSRWMGRRIVCYGVMKEYWNQHWPWFLRDDTFPWCFTELYYDVPQFSPYEALWQYATLWILHKMAEKSQRYWRMSWLQYLQSWIRSTDTVFQCIPVVISLLFFTYFLDSMINIPWIQCIITHCFLIEIPWFH